MPKNNNIKKIFRLYTISDFEEEQEFLTRQHRQGYKFIKYTFPGIYYFEACEPENMNYQLDFADVPVNERDSYLQMFQDCGWEYIQNVLGFNYFRKKAIKEGEDLSIFSDAESKILLLKKIVKSRLLPLLLIFFMVILPQLITYGVRWVVKGYVSTYEFGIIVFFSLMLFLYIFIFLQVGVGFIRLKKKYKK